MQAIVLLLIASACPVLKGTYTSQSYGTPISRLINSRSVEQQVQEEVTLEFKSKYHQLAGFRECLQIVCPRGRVGRFRMHNALR